MEGSFAEIHVVNDQSSSPEVQRDDRIEVCNELFRKLDNDLRNDNHQGISVNKAKLTNLTAQIPDVQQFTLDLIPETQEDFLIDNINLFPSTVDLSRIASELVKKHGYSAFTQIIDSPNFSSVDKNQLMNDCGDMEADCIRFVQGLDVEVAKKILSLSKNFSGYIIHDIENFKPENHREIAQLLINSGLKNEVVYNLEHFCLDDMDDLVNKNNQNQLEHVFDLMNTVRNISSFQKVDHQELVNEMTSNPSTLPELARFFSSLSGVNFNEIITELDKRGLINVENMFNQFDIEALHILAEEGYDFKFSPEQAEDANQKLSSLFSLMEQHDCPHYLAKINNVSSYLRDGKMVEDDQLPQPRTEKIEPYKSFNICGQLADFYLKRLFDFELVRPIRESMAPIPPGGSGQLWGEELEFRKLLDNAQLAEISSFVNEGTDELHNTIRQFVLAAVAEETKSVQSKYDKNHELFNNPSRLIKQGNVEEIQRFLIRSKEMLGQEKESGLTYRAGEAWEKIAELGMDLWDKEPNKIHLIDLAVDIAHNGGSIFNKNDDGRKLNSSTNDIQKLLDKKFQVSTFMEFFTYCSDRNYISPDQTKRYVEMAQKADEIRQKLTNPLSTKPANYE